MIIVELDLKDSSNGVREYEVCTNLNENNHLNNNLPLALLSRQRSLSFWNKMVSCQSIHSLFGRYLNGSRMIRHGNILSRERLAMMNLEVANDLSWWHYGLRTVRECEWYARNLSQDSWIFAWNLFNINSIILVDLSGGWHFFCHLSYMTVFMTYI